MKCKEELTQLAIDVVTNKVFMTQDIQAIDSAFMVILALLDDESRQKMIDAKPVAFYEYYEKAGPRSVNGYPSFFSMQWIPEEEWQVFWPIFEEKYNALYGEQK